MAGFSETKRIQCYWMQLYSYIPLNLQTSLFMIIVMVDIIKFIISPFYLKQQ